MSNIDAINEAAEKYFEANKITLSGVSSGEYIDKEDFLKYAAQFQSEQKQSGQSAAIEIVKELAEWSLRYPRNVTYSSSRQPKMDGELIALEEKAKKWLESPQKQLSDWSALEKIGTPEKWLKVYEHYQELLQREDVANWYAEQFEMANRERNELKAKQLSNEEILFNFCKYLGTEGYKINGYDDEMLRTTIKDYHAALNNTSPGP